MALAASVNRYMSSQAPWAALESDPARARTIPRGGAPIVPADIAGGEGIGVPVGAPDADDPLCTFPTSQRHLRKHGDSMVPKVIDFETVTRWARDRCRASRIETL